jgi:hypothetical protein
MQGVLVQAAGRNAWQEGKMKGNDLRSPEFQKRTALENQT